MASGARMHPPLREPKKLSSNVQPGTKRPPSRRGVLFAVSGDATNIITNLNNFQAGPYVWMNPANGSVLIDDNLPARAGYSMPANFGPVWAAGVTKYRTNQKDSKGDYIWVNVTGPYVCDPSTMAGGSWILVDTDSRSIVCPLQGVSSQMPSNWEVGMAGHTHDGSTGPLGNQNPSYIGLSQSNPMPDVTVGPVCTPSSVTFTTTDVGYTTFDATCSFQLDQTISSDWLAHVRLYVVKEGGAAPTAHTKEHLTLPPTSDGNYSPVISSIPFFRGTGWDIYVSYEDTAHNISAPTLIGTIAATATGNMVQGLPSGIAASGPTVTAFSVTRTRSTGASQELAVSLTESDFTSTVPSWLGGIELVVRRDGGSVPTIAKTIDPSSSTSGTFTDSILGLAGTAHDIGVRYVATDGQKSAIVWPSGGNVADPDGVLLSNTDGTMAYARHNAAVKTALDSTGRLIGSLYDGTNTRTPANITAAIDGSGRLVGAIYDGTNSRTLANITAAIDGNGRIIGSIYDGTTALTPANLTSAITSSGQVKVANAFGTLPRTNTDSSFTTAVDSSGRLIGSIYDGTNSRTPANVTAAIDGSGRIIGSVYDGTTALTPANLTSAVNTSGQVKVANATGNLPYANSSSVIQAAIDASSRLIGNIYDGSTALTPANITSAISTSGQVKVANATGLLPRANTDTSITNAIDSSGRIIGSIYDGTTTLTPANLTSAISASGQVKVANATGLLPYANVPTVIQNAINSSGQYVTSLFPGTALNADGSYSGFTTGGIDSSQAFTIGAGQTIGIEFQFKLAATGATMYFGIGSGTTSGYGIVWNASGTLQLYKVAGGTFSTFATIATIAQDTNTHSVELQITQGTNNTVEVSFDKTNSSVTDNAVVLTTGTYTFAIIDGNGGTTKFYNFQLHTAVPTYTRLPAVAKAAIDTNGRIIGSVYDGTTALTPANLTNAITNAGLLKVANATGSLPRGNTDSSLTSAIDSSGRLVGSIYDGTTALTPANLTNVINTSGQLKLVNSSGALPYTNLPAVIQTAVDSSGRLIGNVYDGTNSRTPSSITSTVLAAGGIDFSSSLHINKTLDNINDGATYARLLAAGVTSGYATKTRTLAAAYTIKGVGDPNTLSLDSEIADGSTYQRVKASELTTGYVKQLNDGTNVRTAAQIAAAIDSSSNILANPFGSSSGVKYNNADGSLTGFSGAVSTIQSYPTETAIVVYLDFISGSTSGTFEVGIGSTTNGYSVKWTASGSSGSCYVTRYNGGTATQLGSGPLTTALFPTSTSRIRLAVDFSNQLIEATVEVGGLTLPALFAPASDSGGPWSSFSGSAVPIWINANGTSGKIQNLQINTRSLFLASSQPIINVIDPNYLTNGGHGLLANIVDQRSIQNNAVYAQNINGLTGTGAVSLDSIPDGSTYGRAKLAGLSSGYAVKTGSAGAYTIKGVGDSSTLSLDSEIADGTTYARVLKAGLVAGYATKTTTTGIGTYTIKGVGDANTLSLDSEIADGTTYARVNKTNISNGNINGTGFTATASYWNQDGSVNFPGSPQSTASAWPITAGFMLTFSGWLAGGGIAGAVNVLIGNETNGIGIRWAATGAVSLVTYKAGTATVGSTFVTVTRDLNYHWFSIKYTPGTTPGTSDTYVLYFDKTVSSGTTGTAVVTWGSTAPVTFDGSTAGGKLLDWRVSSNNP